MPANRFYLPEDLKANASVEITGDELHHMTRVMRCSENESVELVNGKGSLAEATIVKIDKRKASLQIHSVEKRKPPTQPLILAQGIPKLSKLEWILEKATEIGATEFWLIVTEHSEVRVISENRLKRLRAITISAMKQCGRLDLPTIQIFSSLRNLPKPGMPAYFGDIREKAPLLTGGPGVIFIGPEQGFTDQEITCLEEKIGAVGVKLLPNVLRTETAALVATTLLHSFS